MAKNNVFIAGVGDAEIFDGDSLFASARTLIDSSITIGTSVEDLRAGRGNALWGRYFHSSTFELKLTDAMFNLEYLAANVGADVDFGGDVFKNEELVAADDGTIKLTATAVPVRSNGKTYAYVRKASDGGAKPIAVEVNAENKISGLDKGEVYCIRYMYTDGASRKITINSNFVPAVFSVIITAPLFSGDACGEANAAEVGQLTIKVPRFQLNGSQELSMSASGISNTSFEGSALASGCTGCTDSGIYAEIIETIFDSVWYDNFTGIIFDEASVTIPAGTQADVPLKIMAIPQTGYPEVIDNTWIEQREQAVAEDKKTELKITLEAGSTTLTLAEGDTKVSGATPVAGEAKVTAAVVNKKTGEAIPGFEAEKTITVKAAG